MVTHSKQINNSRNLSMYMFAAHKGGTIPVVDIILPVSYTLVGYKQDEEN